METDNIYNIIKIFADAAVFISLIIVFLEFRRTKKNRKIDNTRNLRKATIDCYNEINNETKQLIESIIVGKIQIDVNSILEKKSHRKLHKQIRRYLSLMERFSVGVLSYVYDIEVFDRIHGKTTLEMYRSLKPYIDYVKNTKGEFYYCDFESLVKELTIIREERGSKYTDDFYEVTSPLNKRKRKHKNDTLRNRLARTI